MITAEVVGEVARTGQPASLAGWELTIMTIMRKTTALDWSGGFYIMDPYGELIPDPGHSNWVADYCMLNEDAAVRVAQDLNRERPWDAARVMRAIAAHQPVPKIEAGRNGTPVLVGEIISKN